MSYFIRASEAIKVTGANLTSEELEPSAPAVLVNVWQLVHTKGYAVSWQRYSSSQQCKNLFPCQRSHQLRGSVFNIMFSNHRWWDEKMNCSCSNVICVFINLQRMRFSFTSRVWFSCLLIYYNIYTFLSHTLYVFPEPDCNGKACSNGGKLDLNTCTCTCVEPEPLHLPDKDCAGKVTF